MSEQHSSISSQNYGKISRWLRFCRWLWKYPLPFLVSTILINVVINIGSNALIASSDTKAIPATSLIGRLTEWAGTHWLTTLLFAAFSIALLLVTWRGSREPESASSVLNQAQMSMQNRERLLRRLHLRYEQLLAQSLQGAVEIELGLTSRPATIQNAMSLLLRLPEQPEQALPTHTSILDVYNKAQQELLILGEPGAGKSMLLLKLAQHLVAQAERDIIQPLPILFPLSTWAVKRLPLQEWLIEQCALLYDVPRKSSSQWIATEQLIPLLDGLDEMEETARADCIAMINRYHQDHLQPLVVCSRTNEYEMATKLEKLSLHAAVVVQPLSSTQIDAHLERMGKPLAGLRTALRMNNKLHEITNTPLMLQVLMLTYYGLLGIPVRVFPQQESQLRKQIWIDYVQHMVNYKGNRKHYPLQVTVRWLSWLARQMKTHNQTIFFLEQLQTDWLPIKRKISYRLASILVFLLVFLLISLLISGGVGALLGIINNGANGWIDGGGVGWIIGGPFGILVGILVGALDTKIEPVETLVWSKKRLFAGLGAGLLIGLSIGLRFGLKSGIVFGLFFVLLFILGSGFSGEQLTDHLRLSPNEGIRRSLKNGLIIGLLSGGVFGLLFGMVSGLASGPVSGLEGGLVFGPIFGLIIGGGSRLVVGMLVGVMAGIIAGIIAGVIIGLLIGMITGLLVGLFFWRNGGLRSGLGNGFGAVLQHYFLRFWLRSSFPLRAVPFLEDATSRVLLRRVGGGYSFTHHLLLDYFADLETAPPAPSSNPHPVPPPLAP